MGMIPRNVSDFHQRASVLSACSNRRWSSHSRTSAAAIWRTIFSGQPAARKRARYSAYASLVTFNQPYCRAVGRGKVGAFVGPDAFVTTPADDVAEIDWLTGTA